ncbi:class II fructose-bisphosphate aldolase [Olsenella massiliensis]|uniref:class II fructose-bisphosphate aldolase n=1 Tax=Olsenella massiliensis TaxID=1622075 RepID=UPI00071D2695|nr:class II fructose-bisphosphate aldolase [Olsenella massiliensis]
MYESMRGMLQKARQEGYAVMAINAFDLESAAGIIHAATEMRSPIIIDLLQDHVKAYFDCDVLTRPIIRMAQEAPVPVAINLDHGSDVAHLKRCLHEGFSSVMIDASGHAFEENVRITRSIVEFAQEFGASVEAEVGSMGLVGTGAGFTEAAMYTNPDVAIEFIQKTGVDALAVSFGSTHGDYPQGYVPTFHFEIVEAIRSATDVPLVLHGGSGSGAENIRRAIACGINKINVGTDYMIAQRDFVAKALQTDPDIEYPELLHRAYLEASKVVQSYIELAGSKGKAW